MWPTYDKIQSMVASVVSLQEGRQGGDGTHSENYKKTRNNNDSNNNRSLTITHWLRRSIHTYKLPRRTAQQIPAHRPGITTGFSTGKKQPHRAYNPVGIHQMAPPEHTSDKQAYYSFIDPERMKGWVRVEFRLKSADIQASHELRWKLVAWVARHFVSVTVMSLFHHQTMFNVDVESILACHLQTLFNFDKEGWLSAEERDLSMHLLTARNMV